MNESSIARKNSTWWKDLCKACDVGNNDNCFDNNVKWYIKDGKNVRFWDDRWVGDLPLKERFPRLYAISLCKENVLNELGKWEGEVCKWNLLWRREMFTWEREIFIGLYGAVRIFSTEQG